MRCDKRIVTAKLKDRSGFTLAEQLISVIFLGLLILAVGVGMSAALNISNKASIVTAADQLMKRSIQEVNNELIFSIQVEASGAGSDARFLSASTRTIVGFSNESDESGTSLGIALIGEGVGGQNVDSVISYPPRTILCRVFQGWFMTK